MANYRRAILQLRQVAKESKKSIVRILIDYILLWKKKRLLWKEYYNYRFETRDDSFRRGFLGGIEEGVYLELLNPYKYYILARNKYLAHLLLSKAGIPMPDLYCYYSPESGDSSAGNISFDLTSTLEILKAKNVRECVIKGTEGSHGDAVFAVKNITYEATDALLELSTGNGECIRLSSILKQYPLLFEQRIFQTRQLSSFNSTSVNTVRFMTVLLPDGEAKIIATFIKIGRMGAFVDNAGKGGNVDAGIDSRTGRIYGAIEFNGFRKTIDINNHPDTGAALNGVVIDDWDNICRQMCSFQQKVPFLKAIGWDVAITETGPVIIEFNDFWDTTGQLFIRRGWQSDIRQCYVSWRDYNDKAGVDYRMGRTGTPKRKRFI